MAQDDPRKRLPRIEQEILARLGQGEHPDDLAERYGVTRAAVNYRARRARRRLELLAKYPAAQVTRQEIDRDLHWLTERERSYLYELLHSTCGAEASRLHGLTHKNAWDVVTRLRRKLRREDPGSPHLAALKFLRAHPRFLHDQPNVHRGPRR